MLSELRVLMSVPDVGDGNPAAMFSQAEQLLRGGFKVDTQLQGGPFALAKRYHKVLRADPKKALEYSQNGEVTRSRLGKPLGYAAILEFVRRNPLDLIPLGSSGYFCLIGTQEFQFRGMERGYLERKYPRRYMYIPDVYSKNSSDEVMQKLGFTALVWNPEALAQLEDKHIRAVMVEPSLPNGFLNGHSIKAAGELIVAKSSGSNWPKEYTPTLEKAFSEIGIDYTISTSEARITRGTVFPAIAQTEQRVKEFYQELLYRTPKLLIAYPSEMVQVAAVLAPFGTRFLPLPPVGVHEVRNLNWAFDNGLCSEVLDPINDTDVTGKIKAHLEVAASFDRKQLILGTTSLPQALLKASS